MKRLLSSLALLFTCCISNAQLNIDSLLYVKNQIESSESFNESHYSETVNSIIYCYIQQSDYYLAKQIIENGIETLKHQGVVNDKSMRILYCYSGLIEYYLKNYVDALKIFEKTVNMCQEVDDVGDEFIIAMCNAANVCNDVQHYEDMKKIMDAAVEIYEQHHGSIFKITDEKHFILVNNYGVANYNVGNNYIAGKCYRYVIDNCKGTFESNNALQLAINNYAVALIQNGLMSQAAKLLEKTRTQNSDYGYKIAQTLLCAYFVNWKIKQTAESLVLFNDIAIDNVCHIFADFPKTIRDNYWSTISSETMSLNNMIAYFHKNPDCSKQAYNMTLFCKNLLLNSDEIIEEYILKSSDIALKQCFKDYKALKHEFLFQTYDSIKAISCKSEIEKKEETIIHKIDDLHSLLINSSKKWEDVKKSLSEREYAIEYGQMFGSNNNGGTDTLYCAMVVGNSFQTPKIVLSLFVNQFDSIFINNNGDKLFYSELYNNRTMALYKILFAEIEKLIPDATTIYYSPYGNLSQLNFDTFLDDFGTPLNQKYKMVRVSSTAEIPQVKARDLQNLSSAALYGNINYDTSFYDSSRGSKFGRLKNAGKEINSISNILKGQNITSTIFDRTSATEESFKNLSGKSPEILHLATHGFCFETDEKAADKPFAQNVNSYSQKESAMVLSGLALSGANNIWKGNFDLPNAEDGILTAYEISQLDLSNTRLAVLSACETARGRIFPVDGVFGLQRAFKQAGAGSILMSLWKVDDAATAIFMENFYKFLFETHDRHAALKMAQSEVKKQHPDPYYWAAWVLLD